METRMKPVIALVFKSGGDFEYKHVVDLYLQLAATAKWEGHVVCLTDQIADWAPSGIELLPLTRKFKGWWSKLELCAPEHDRLGDLLYFDLDTLVVGAIDEIAAVGKLTLLSDFLQPSRLASGMMYLPVKARQNAWELLHAGAGADLVVKTWHRRGDQAFFEFCWRHEAQRWQDVLPGQVVSFKQDVLPNGGCPDGARVICFHGKPRPWER